MLNPLIPEHEMAARLVRLEKVVEDLKGLEGGGSLVLYATSTPVDVTGTLTETTVFSRALPDLGSDQYAQLDIEFTYLQNTANPGPTIRVYLDASLFFSFQVLVTTASATRRVGHFRSLLKADGGPNAQYSIGKYQQVLAGGGVPGAEQQTFGGFGTLALAGTAGRSLIVTVQQASVSASFAWTLEMARLTGPYTP